MRQKSPEKPSGLDVFVAVSFFGEPFAENYVLEEVQR